MASLGRQQGRQVVYRAEHQGRRMNRLGQYAVNVVFTLLLWAASTAILGAIARVMFSIAAFGWHMLD